VVAKQTEAVDVDLAEFYNKCAGSFNWYLVTSRESTIVHLDVTLLQSMPQSHIFKSALFSHSPSFNDLSFSARLLLRDRLTIYWNLV